MQTSSKKYVSPVTTPDVTFAMALQEGDIGPTQYPHLKDADNLAPGQFGVEAVIDLNWKNRLAVFISSIVAKNMHVRITVQADVTVTRMRSTSAVYFMLPEWMRTIRVKIIWWWNK